MTELEKLDRNIQEVERRCDKLHAHGNWSDEMLMNGLLEDLKAQRDTLLAELNH